MIKECANCDHRFDFFGHVIGCQLGVKPESPKGWGCKKHSGREKEGKQG